MTAEREKTDGKSSVERKHGKSSRDAREGDGRQSWHRTADVHVAERQRGAQRMGRVTFKEASDIKGDLNLHGDRS